MIPDNAFELGGIYATAFFKTLIAGGSVGNQLALFGGDGDTVRRIMNTLTPQSSYEQLRTIIDGNEAGAKFAAIIVDVHDALEFLERPQALMIEVFDYTAMSTDKIAIPYSSSTKFKPFNIYDPVSPTISLGNRAARLSAVISLLQGAVKHPEFDTVWGQHYRGEMIA